MSTRTSLLLRMLVAFGLVSAVSVAVVLVAAAVTGTTVLAGVALAAATADVFVFPFVDRTLSGRLWARPTSTLAAVAVAIGLASAPTLAFAPVRDEIQEFRADLGATGQSASERHPEITGMAQRLAQQAGIPEPEVRIVNRMRPESYALGGKSSGTIVITRGIVRSLEQDAIEAVLAHEVSHLTNGDSRIMHLLLVPLVLAEHLAPDAPPTFRPLYGFGIVHYGVELAIWAILTFVTTVGATLCHLGVAVCSRGREFAADSRAAELTGSPETLASALETLDDARGRPGTDLRDYRRSAGTLDILPDAAQREWRGPFRTHPETEVRIDRLLAMASDER